MSVWQIVVREIRHRWVNFALGVLCALVAVGTLVGALTLLSAHDLRTQRLLEADAEREKARLAENKDDYRKLAKELGFNLLVLHAKQDPGELFTENDISKHMPESYAKKLADSPIVSINHLLPILQHKVTWPERDRSVILIGTRGEIPLMFRDPNPDPKEAMLHPVEPGTVILGAELARDAIHQGEAITFMGRVLNVAKIYKPRGNADDVSMWMDLDEAQDLLFAHGVTPEHEVINAMLAINCQCHGANPEKVVADVQKGLPDTQIIPQVEPREIRRKMRGTAAAFEKKTLSESSEGRAALRHERETFATILVPVVLVGCAVFVAALAFVNVRERRSEIGILRALGMSSTKLVSVFLLKAALTGLLGAVVGYLVGYILGTIAGDAALSVASARALFDPVLLVLVLVLAPLVAALASWLPALVASQQDPAVVLSEE
jgi:hypothetical protein